ncbi:putative holin-like toxin [Enterococcus innesii]|nr:putative holin-like toxin [uncultured Enterococcus sp.]
MSAAEAIGLMISFGTFTAMLIFGILVAVKNDKKKITVDFNRETVIF